jgi:hypothetical protein
MKTKPSRVKLSKDEMINKMQSDAKLAKLVSLVKLIFPMVENQKTIYNAQTVFFATAGFIEAGIKEKIEKLTVADLGIDITKQEECDEKESMKQIFGLIEIENARDMADLLKKVGDHIGQFGAAEFVKGPMSGLKVSDIVK